jgi:hypothetical protein
MPDYIFTVKALPPSETSLVKALADSYPYYLALLGLAGGYKRDWQFYKSYGWLLKVTDGSKALFYVVPLAGAFKLSLTIRENERAALLENTAVAFFREDIRNAKKYPEGYALQFIVKDEASLSECMSLIGALIRLR